MLSLRKQQGGDTIVEVLFAIVVIASVLVAAYATTIRNTSITQDTQEHATALKIAQSQIENLRVAQTFPATSQCFDPSGHPNSVASSDAYTGSEQDLMCNIQQPTGVGAIYHIRLTQASGTYQVNITWDSLINGQRDAVPLYYRPEVGP